MKIDLSCLLQRAPRNDLKVVSFVAALFLYASGSGLWAADPQLPPSEDPFFSEKTNTTQWMGTKENDPLLAEQMTIELQEALRLIGAGDYENAVKLAYKVVRQRPDWPTPVEIVGVALTKMGDLDAGLKMFQLAIDLNPRQNTAMTKMGDIYLAKKDAPKAKAQFLRAIAANPADRMAHQRLGTILDSEGDTAQAIEHYEKGLVGTPKDYLGIKVDLGRLYNQTGMFKKTVSLLSPIVTPECPVATAHVVLGTAYVALKKSKEAVAAFDLARKLEPDADRTRLCLGIAYREAGDFNKSLSEFKAMLKAKPESSVAHYQQAETYLSMGSTNKALEAFEAASKCSAQPTRIQTRMAEILANQRKFDEAIALYEKVRSSGKATMRAYDGLATVYQVSGRLEDGKKVLLEACAKGMDPAFANYRLGLFYGSTQDYAAACESLRKANAASPADPRVLKALSLAYSRMGKTTEAIATARKLNSVVTNSPEDMVYLGALLEDAKDTAGAKKLYQDSLKLDANNVIALNNLAGLTAAAGDLGEAAKLSGRAAELAPSSPAVQDTHGWILYQAGSYGPACKALQKAVAAFPDNPTYRYHLGMASKKAGDSKAAIVNLDKALASPQDFPGRQEAAEALKALKK